MSDSQTPSMKDAGQARTEAADWQARLARDSRATTRRDFEAWLAADAAHEKAFGLVGEIWADLPGLRAALGEAPAVRPFRRPAPRRSYVGVGLALAAGLVCVAVGLELYPRLSPQVFTTGHGEGRAVALADGSTLALNTDTEAAVSYSLLQRRVVLRKGEAVFDVKKHQRRPFVVAAGPQQVRAVGTSFLVRDDDARAVRVVLFEGKVAITGGAAGKVMLDPGQGWTTAGGKVALAPSALQAAGAWRRGEIVFENAPIAEAVAEMNRYGAQPIVIAAGVDQQLRVTGIFRTGQSPAFARSIAAIYGLEAKESAEGLTLEKRNRP